MDPKTINLVPDHVLNIMSQEQEFNIPSNSSPKTALEPIAIDHDLNSMRKWYEINIPGTPGRRTTSEVVGATSDFNTVTQEPEATYANADTSVESSTCNRKASKSLPSGCKREDANSLFEAAVRSDWGAAKVILDKHPELVRFAISPNGDTAIHIAVRAKATKQSEIFVENLLGMMKIEDLELLNESGDGAYMIAAAKGNVHMFEVIVNKHEELLSIFREKTLVALDTSAIYGNHDMTLHFYNVLKKSRRRFWGEAELCLFFMKCIHGDLFDIALEVLKDYQFIGTSLKTCFLSLHILARRPDTINRTETDAWMIRRILNSILAFFPEMDNQALKLVQRLLKLYPSCGQHDILDDTSMSVDDKKVLAMGMDHRELLFAAAQVGNTRFVVELARTFNDIIFETKEGGLSIFHIAIKHRHQGIYNLFYETGSLNGPLTMWEDDEKNNILHLVAMRSHDTTQLQAASRPSLQLQRDLLWFKDVEKMVPPLFRNKRNDDGKTPYEILSENNKELVSKGVEWTKDFMVFDTLIMTLAITLAFNVSGGYNPKSGTPKFNPDTSFLVFVIADAFAFFAALTSFVVFLSSNLTSPGLRDFLYVMPGKLMIGVVTLFMSVAAMTVTIAAIFIVNYQSTFKRLPYLISVFAATPVIIHAALQYPFVTDMFRSVFDSRYLFNTRTRMLYNKNKRQ